MQPDSIQQKNSSEMINAMLIGVQKAGTSSLYNWISQHPEIEAPAEMKDYHHFTDSKLDVAEAQIHNQYYKSQNKVRVKGAVNYIYHDFIAEKLKAYNPDLKFIIVLRNPVDRAISAYNYFRKLGLEKRTLKQAISEEASIKREDIVSGSHHTYVGHGFYSTQLQRYLDHFKKEQLLILDFESLIEEPQENLKKVFSFLNIDENFEPKITKINVTNKARIESVNEIFFDKKNLPFLRNLLSNILPMKWKTRLANWLVRVNTSKKNTEEEEVNDEIIDKLKDEFTNEKAALSQMLQKDYDSIWSF